MLLPFDIFTGATRLETASVWLAASAFLIGGFVNAIGVQKIRTSFERLGFPGWWCWVTAAIEVATACLLIGAGTRTVGIILGACTMLAAIAAIVRIRHYRELPPPLLFLVFLTLAGFSGHT
jgi:uncharacterized membrane protein YphA (DoxX/SURF4 family)